MVWMNEWILVLAGDSDLNKLPFERVNSDLVLAIPTVSDGN